MAPDADDAVQETMVRAWKALEGLDGRIAAQTSFLDTPSLFPLFGLPVRLQ